MRPPIDDSLVTALRSHLPEFEDTYLDLLDIYDEDLTVEIVVMGLAEFVIDLLLDGDREEAVERCLEAVEGLAATEEGAELVGYSFLNLLPPAARAAVGEQLGPVSSRLALEFWHGEVLGVGRDSAGDGNEVLEDASDRNVRRE